MSLVLGDGLHTHTVYGAGLLLAVGTWPAWPSSASPGPMRLTAPGERLSALPRHRLCLHVGRAVLPRPRDHFSHPWHAADHRRRRRCHLAAWPPGAGAQGQPIQPKRILDAPHHPHRPRGLARPDRRPVLDCSFRSRRPRAGARATAGHIPGAHYLHLDRDLCGPKTDTAGRFLGRHPLPSREGPSCPGSITGLRAGQQVAGLATAAAACTGPGFAVAALAGLC